MADLFLKFVASGKNNNKSLKAVKDQFNAYSSPSNLSQSQGPIRLDGSFLGNNQSFVERKQHSQAAKKADKSETAHTKTQKQITKEPKSTVKQTKIPLPSTQDTDQVRKKNAIHIEGADVPNLLPSFDLLAQECAVPPFIHQNIISSLQQGGFGFSEPTPIQMQAIPALNTGRDVLAFAPTGTGKTLSFCLPLITKLFNMAQADLNAKAAGHPNVLNHYALPFNGIILCPTRELALQTHRVMKKMLRRREEYFFGTAGPVDDNMPFVSAEREQEYQSIPRIQPVLITKRYKMRVINNYHERIVGKKLDQEAVTQLEKEVVGETELQDDDDDNDDSEILHANKSSSDGRPVYTALIATPMLFLSLLDRCSRIMRRDVDIKNAIANDLPIPKPSTRKASSSSTTTKQNTKKNQSILDEDGGEDEQDVTKASTSNNLASSNDSDESKYPKLIPKCAMVVIDECDRLLDLGFIQQVDIIFSHIARTRMEYRLVEESVGESSSSSSAAKSKQKKDKKDKKQLVAAVAPSSSTQTWKQVEVRMPIAIASATITQSVRELSQTFFLSPIKITVGDENVAQLLVKQRLEYVMNEDGKRLGIKQLVAKGTSLPMLIFVQSKERAMQLFQELQYTFTWLGNITTNPQNTQLTSSTTSSSSVPSFKEQYAKKYGKSVLSKSSTPARNSSIASIASKATSTRIAVLHSDLTESDRLDIVTKFRVGEIWILLCTDVISRGLDFLHVKCVLNYDFPSSVATYLHRIGRTGRAGNRGVSITFVADEDRPLLGNIANVVATSEQMQYDQNVADRKEARLLQRNDDDEDEYDDEEQDEEIPPFKSSVPQWMLDIPLVDENSSRRLIFKQPVRSNITHNGYKAKVRHFEQQVVAHHKRQAAERLGIQSRNESGKALKDKLADHKGKLQAPRPTKRSFAPEQSNTANTQKSVKKHKGNNHKK